jgi:ankyrin repeat protein
MAAARSGDMDTVAALVAHGVPLDVTDKGGLPALVYAAAMGEMGIARRLLEAGAQAGRDEVFVAGAFANHSPIVEYLLAQGIGVNTLDRLGRTALMGAAASGNVALVKTLLSKGAKKDVVDRDARDALMYAVKGGHTDIAKLLEPK